MKGFVLVSSNSLYRVALEDGGERLCTSRGKIKNQRQRAKNPILAGDVVDIEIIDEENGTIEKVYPRNTLIERGGNYKRSRAQPVVANVDRALVVFAADRPRAKISSIDRYLVSVEYQKLDLSLVFNKWDLADEEAKLTLDIYQKAGYSCTTLSATDDPETCRQKILDLDFQRLYICGPSGVGKTTLTNVIFPDRHGAVGEVSHKIGRGKQTTTHIEFLPLHDDQNRYLVDTPGVGQLMIEGMDSHNLKNFYREFLEFAPDCQYRNCLHLDEPGCSVIEQVGEVIHPIRYQSYLEFYDSIREQEKKSP